MICCGATEVDVWLKSVWVVCALVSLMLPAIVELGDQDVCWDNANALFDPCENNKGIQKPKNTYPLALTFPYFKKL